MKMVVFFQISRRMFADFRLILNPQMSNIKKTMPELDRLSAKDFKETDKIPLTILLDDVRSMHNVGSVFRSADSFLVEKIYLCGYTPAPPHRDIHKTALGATETVSWQWEKDILTCLQTLKKEQYKIYAIEQVHNSIMMNQFVPDKLQKTALIFGNEVNGVSQQAIDLCDACIEIPQLGSKHSLNISVSAGIVLWHWAKEYL